MAPLVAPKSLYRACLLATAEQIDVACTNIFVANGVLWNQECFKATEELQSYLVSRLPTTVFEQLSEERNVGTRPLVPWNRDPKIKLAVFLHASITCFNVDAKGNELLRRPYNNPEKLFWWIQLPKLKNLVQLNLNLITTDYILMLMGRECPKLEVVNIVSRIGQEISGAADFPTFTLHFGVSDVGLLALANCKRLRRITMNKSTAHRNSGFTIDGVRHLVRCLPHLEFVNFSSTGTVLSGILTQEANDGIDRKFKLTYFSEMDPSFMDVRMVQSYCPHIRHVSLSLPTSYDGTSPVGANVQRCNEILQALADSTLPLRVVELQHFPYGEPFRNLLRHKGNNLDELLLRANGQLNSSHISFIGENCPRLQRLHLKEVGLEEGPVVDTRSNLFSSLCVLHLSGFMWNPNVVLPLLLSAAKDISQVSLSNMSYRLSMDDAVEQVLRRNDLSFLVSLTLHCGCFLSLRLIRRLAIGAPSLRLFCFLQASDCEISDIWALRRELINRNMDIRLCCLE